MDDGGGTAAADELVRASRAGDEAAVSRLLSRGVPVDARDAEGCTGMYLAVHEGRDGVVRVLLAAGADPEQITGLYAEDLPLIQAASEGHTAIVRQLLAAGARPDRPNRLGATPLGRAAFRGHTDIARVLLEHGADPQLRWRNRTPLQWAEHRGSTETAEFLRTWAAGRGGPAATA
ncbi:ankyrin repeat domain-containing protein [Streptomyces sp. ZAF1911]|uniref:ankyrin repeat domain-containing protein n=1 Tax=Streptomyces sp. ZAF1911 TaxID=2944129 RepID=UPI00237A6D63|nr:ankyrin repeat domain-containing protein [Streptomyces sp. ZAF1911]MDD9381311.1 ankyrin repeat domain-containing protein [Streptomyces sp. ZAF1911]